MVEMKQRHAPNPIQMYSENRMFPDEYQYSVLECRIGTNNLFDGVKDLSEDPKGYFRQFCKLPLVC